MRAMNRIYAKFSEDSINFTYTGLPNVNKQKQAYIILFNTLNRGILDLDTFKINENNKFDLNSLINNLRLKIEMNLKKWNIDINDLNFTIDENIYIEEINESNINSICSFIKSNININIIVEEKDIKKIINFSENDNFPNLYVKLDRSIPLVTYSEMKKTYDTLDKIVNFINKYNLSPLEIIILIYDIVKSNEYNEEEQNEDYRNSRDLNKIIEGDKIVCLGFANLLEYLLTNLGFINEVIYVGKKEDKQSIHSRNMVHLKDSKYNIDGMFFLDATGDSKKDDNYIDNYEYFLKSFDFFSLDDECPYITIPEELNILNYNDMLLEYEKKNITDDEIINCFSHTEKNIDSLSNTDIKSILQNLRQIYNQRLPKEAFKNALYKVRRIEYLNNIFKSDLFDKYDQNFEFETNDQFNNYLNNIVYPDRSYDEAFAKLYKKQLKPLPTIDSALKDVGAESISQDILRLKFLKQLKEQLNDFPQDDFIKKM